MGELLELAEKLLAEATVEQDRLAEAVHTAEHTLVTRRRKLEDAQRRVRELNADISALKARSGHLKIVG